MSTNEMSYNESIGFIFIFFIYIFFFINFYKRREWKVSESTTKKQLEIKKKTKKQLQQFPSIICILWILKSKKLKTEVRNLWGDVKHIPEILIKESFGFI